MKHLEYINERYKEPTEFKTNSFGFDYGVRNYVDDVFDHVKGIIEDVEHVSEKSFKQLDEIHKRTEELFDKFIKEYYARD